jgi:hypothetical protein
MFEFLNKAFSECYNPSENLSVGEVIIVFKGRVVSKQYIPKMNVWHKFIQIT